MKDRIGKYKAGDSISAIARAEGVSRQAIICYLKNHGVYGDVRDTTSLVGDTTGVVRDGVIKGGSKHCDCPIDNVPDKSPADYGTKLEKVSRNLWINKNGFEVKYWESGEGMVIERYPDAESVKKAYGML